MSGLPRWEGPKSPEPTMSHLFRRSFRHIQMLAKQQSHTLTLGQLMRPRNQGLILICVYFISCLWIPFLYIHPCQQWTFTYHLCFWSIFYFCDCFLYQDDISTINRFWQREISFGKEHTLRHSLFDSAGKDLPVYMRWNMLKAAKIVRKKMGQQEVRRRFYETISIWLCSHDVGMPFLHHYTKKSMKRCQQRMHQKSRKALDSMI